ncbi:MAG: helix-hairpin-helix domain-containing protein [Ignavibacteriales bacterium]|nr:helix-hairpin-helix domain-containing protein [Ignavibacteriales bacterium]
MTLKQIADRLALTRTERRVILFLTATMLAGTGIRLYRSAYPASPRFDYRAADSTFASLTAHIQNDGNEPSRASTHISGKLNLNTATKEELNALPGIGVVTAERILQLRDQLGKFSSLDELTHVKGITIKKIEKLRPLIIVE